VNRIAVTDVQPVVDGGRYPAKAIVGRSLTLSAVAYLAGGDGDVQVHAHITQPDGAVVVHPMLLSNAGLDLWTCELRPTAMGMHTFRVKAMLDELGTARRRAFRKMDIGRDVRLELDHLMSVAHRLNVIGSLTPPPAAMADVLLRGTPEDRSALVRSLVEALAPLAGKLPAESSTSPDHPLLVEHRLAEAGAWYQFFPRSEGAQDGASGTFATAKGALDRAASMGFSIVYLPPIHPIGVTNRKGANDTPVAGPGDPGSPWAIGSAFGGHDAVHPDLGTVEDFKGFLDHARSLGIEVALDYALNFSPDHPWVSAYPHWFNRDHHTGELIYASTTDKDYRDIYTLAFDGPFKEDIADACERLIRRWISLGVWIFRVDLPHTKPIWFWRRAIESVKADFPEVIFLAEAFTRPTLMHALSKAGFSQTLTYYLWRESGTELVDYLRELHSVDQTSYFRPNLFVNSHDHLPRHLREGDDASFKVRAAIAALASPSWGMYAGFELLERSGRVDNPDKYAGSEIYQLVHRDWSAPGIRSWIAELNEIRRAHPAVTTLGNLRVHRSDDADVVAFSRVTGEDALLVVAHVGHRQRVSVTVDMGDLATPGISGLGFRDLMSGEVGHWDSGRLLVELDRERAPARIFELHGCAKR
jgi:starch synthase (maltosyl-transferring)